MVLKILNAMAVEFATRLGFVAATASDAEVQSAQLSKLE